ncbi:thiamine phosphate synthase [Paenibacillus turpanensis]|uniref:thiamine phosphate synthase n=1 Tax=Paenibacillus turpanensis TaxID=2689078 RepID=UPI0014076C64|nr:thiamine phosphate synthase [Paenibacillus turpanensis]
MGNGKDFTLYAITGEEFHPGRPLLEVMEEAIVGGVDIIQLRDKSGDREAILRKAKELRQLTRKHGVTFIVNDYIDIALESEADGVHLGQGDIPLAEARKRMGDRIIGISTHEIEEARTAEREGADYIGVGPVFPTKSKVDAVAPVTTAYVRQVAGEIRIPWVAIGGIKLHNVDEVLAAGAARICAISEIVGAQDVAGVCREFRRKIEQSRSTGA